MKKASLLFLVLILFVGLFSCVENPVVNDDENYQITVINDGSFNENLSENSIVDCSIESDMLYNGFDNQMMLNPTPTNVNIPLANILKQLNLTSEQISSVRLYAKEYFDCISRAQKILRATEEAIITRANQARKEVLAQLKTGEINREQAARLIANINQKAREAMKNSDARKAAFKQIQNCLLEYISKIKLILNENQLAKFNELLKRLKSDVIISTRP